MNLWDIVSCHTQRKLRDAGYVIVHRAPTDSMVAAARGGRWVDDEEVMLTFRLMMNESRKIQKRAMEKARREIEARSGQDTLFDLRKAI